MSILTVVASLSGKENGKEIFGHKLLIVASDSMSKSELSKNEKIYFSAGDLIIIKNVENANELNEGDVITFFSYNPQSLGKTVSHKIREIKYQADGSVLGFVTYGINTGKNDANIVKPEDIIGKYQGKIPRVGALFSSLKTQRGFYLSILIPSVLLIIFFSVTLGKLLGKKEYSALYNEDLESVKKRVCVLEKIISDYEKTDEKIPDAEIATKTDGKNTKISEDGGFASIQRKKRTAFISRLDNLSEEQRNYFYSVHNALLSYEKLKPRTSFKGVSYRLSRLLLAKITISGKTLRLHLSLNINDFNKNAFFQKDLSSVKAYSEVPFTVKIKSNRALKNAHKLIYALAEKFELKKHSVNVLEVEEKTTKYPFANGKKNKLSFNARIKNLSEERQNYFNTINNELISYERLKARTSFKGISYRLGRLLLAKITISGKTLRLHLSLNINDFNKNAFFQKDLSSVKAYSEVPFTVKIKSDRAKSNAVKLISALAERYSLKKEKN